MHGVYRSGDQLVIIDYMPPADVLLPSELPEDIDHPMGAAAIRTVHVETGWAMHRGEDAARFMTWYNALMERCRPRRAHIVKFTAEKWYRYVVNWYGNLRAEPADGRLIGMVLIAVADRPHTRNRGDLA